MEAVDIQQELIEKLSARENELMKIPEVQAEMVRIHDAESKDAAKEWLGYQALITLMYTPDERMEMQRKARLKEAA